ncbi:hypothetical protein [uncultured Streptococcus sp.]|uniref:hypothetical protein n=1 Tax=uncultured Streptococcus sp. TaxID=83427 RepID=UPI0028800FF2|nr:hypothetical protein [uncultured Streptococcus sp.]
MENKNWYYKNFNMVSELDISGEFIYHGISIFNNMNIIDLEMPTELFLALYNISVGIERLQKIILVLWEFEGAEPIKEYSESIKIHNHVTLNARIAKAVGGKDNFNKQEHQFLDLLANFYCNARYDRFAEVGNNWEYKLIHKFFDDNHVEYGGSTLNPSIISINDSIRKLIGRVVSKIAKHYYELVEKGSQKSGTYSYELRNDSKAQKIFYHTENKRGLSAIKIDERIAISEILVYLRNTSDKSSYLKFIEEITPLNFDRMEISGYLSVFLLENRVPQYLIDQIENLYDLENINVRERIEQLELMAKDNMQVSFDFPYQKKIYTLLQDIKQRKDISIETTKQLQEANCYIDDRIIQENIESIIDTANKYLNNEISREFFISSFNDIYRNLENDDVIDLWEYLLYEEENYNKENTK